MLITSLIFLLLSNSITLRRDKSILYSRATITILLISTFIAYDNLSFLVYRYKSYYIQLIDQLKGLYYINPVLALSLAITLFSFAGIPPLIGFFGKQMILSAAVDNGYIFMSLVAILTSAISERENIILIYSK